MKGEDPETTSDIDILESITIIKHGVLGTGIGTDKEKKPQDPTA